jgi:hypothetical protein
MINSCVDSAYHALLLGFSAYLLNKNLNIRGVTDTKCKFICRGVLVEYLYIGCETVSGYFDTFNQSHYIVYK